MSSYIELFELATNAEFQKRIRFSLWKAAFDIKNEVETIPDHANRLRWAKAILNNAQVDLGHVAIGVLLNQTVGNAGAAALDSDIQFVVNGLVPELVGT